MKNFSTDIAAARSESRRAVFARLVSEESIAVEFSPNADTAAFDMTNRRMILPVWNIDDTFYDMLIIHETGHALHTPASGWARTAEVDPRPEAAPIVRHYFNAIEDARIERLMLAKYPGAKRDFFKAYSTAHTVDDMFGVRDMSADEINALPFVDRLNLHFKIGRYDLIAPIAFTAAERAILARIERAESFDDVVAIAKDCFDPSFVKQQPQGMQPQPGDDSGAGDDSESDDSSDSNSGGTSMDSNGESESDDSNDSNDSNAGESGSDSNDDSNGESGSESGSDDDEGGDDRASGGSSSESDDDSSGDDSAPTGETGDNDSNSINESQLPEGGSTMDRFSKSLLGKTAKNDSDIKDDTRIMTIDGGDYRKFIRTYKAVLADFAAQSGTAKNDDAYNTFTKMRKNDISYYRSMFNRKKAADEHRRTSINKSGVIDTNRLIQYKWSEEIFKRNTRVADGKNHGFVFLLDWSGSMESILRETIEQLLIITEFCRAEKIPFEVYAFSTATNFGDEDYDETRTRLTSSSMLSIDKKREMLSFTMLEFLSHKMSASEYRRMASNLLLIGDLEAHDSRYSKDYSSYRRPHSYRMGSTPLDEGMLVIRDRILDFRAENGVQICNLIAMTDGASNGLISTSGNIIINDSKYGYVFRKMVQKYSYNYVNITSELAAWVAATTGSNVVNFFLAPRVANADHWFAQMSDTTKAQACRDELKSKRSTHTGQLGGWHDVYIMKIDVSSYWRSYYGGRRRSSSKPKTVTYSKNGPTVGQLTKEIDNKAQDRKAHRNIMNAFMSLMAAGKSVK